jgi:hypothetical protein
VKRRVRNVLRRDTSNGAPEGGVPIQQEAPTRWNLWELEQVAVASEDLDPARHEERALLLLTLRQFAASSGELPREFDTLVRDVFGRALTDSSALTGE